MTGIGGKLSRAAATASFVFLALGAGIACADPLALAEPMRNPAAPFDRVLRDQAVPDPAEDAQSPTVLPSALRRQVVNYATTEPVGTIVIDTPHTYLYLVLDGGKAMRYGIGVGRDGFTWSGIETIARKAEWPDWYPPAEMIQRQPYLPRVMAGGAGNPLGARAMYLGNTEYRIHGTNQPSTIGQHVSSGCIRMLNADVMDLYDRVTIGARVVVLPATANSDRAPVLRVRSRSDTLDRSTVTPVSAQSAPRSLQAFAIY